MASDAGRTINECVNEGLEVVNGKLQKERNAAECQIERTEPRHRQRQKQNERERGK